jgi:TRAP-type C4-dicarboxylate transport system permease small subunit
MLTHVHDAARQNVALPVSSPGEIWFRTGEIMRAIYFNAMAVLHRACVMVASVALVVITLIIPWGVFTRYVLNSASSWPEPLAVLLMIVLSFLSAVICYRDHLHISVGMIPEKLTGSARTALGITIEVIMLGMSIFMLWYGFKLVKTTWYQSIAEFPSIPAGVTYLAIPVAGAITALFVIERFLKGNFFPPPHEIDGVDTISAE